MADARPSKKQQELLSFIDGFIKGNGYGPSYREIMRALGYKSVSTVATHVNGLIAKGYLEKGDDYSARSLALAATAKPDAPKVPGDSSHIAWLRKHESTFREAGDTDAADCMQKAIQLLEAGAKKQA